MTRLYTDEQITTLAAAIASGVLNVTYAGPPQRSVTYQSSEVMQRLLATMIADRDAAAGTRKPYKLAATRKGFG